MMQQDFVWTSSLLANNMPTLHCMVGKSVLTTRTDYIKPYTSVLQTTSYNFTRTQTTGEACIGIVKANPIHYKNSEQHYSDLQTLSEMDSEANF